VAPGACDLELAGRSRRQELGGIGTQLPQLWQGGPASWDLVPLYPTRLRPRPDGRARRAPYTGKEITPEPQCPQSGVRPATGASSRLLGRSCTRLRAQPARLSSASAAGLTRHEAAELLRHLSRRGAPQRAQHAERRRARLDVPAAELLGRGLERGGDVCGRPGLGRTVGFGANMPGLASGDGHVRPGGPVRPHLQVPSLPVEDTKGKRGRVMLR
jgi:hypothetical protein